MRQIRKFKCIESFSTEGRYCYEGEIYEAHPFYDYYKFVFENGEMNFSDELFERVVEEWKDVIEEII